MEHQKLWIRWRHIRPRRGMVWGPPDPPLNSPPATSLSLPKYLHSIAQTQVLAILARDF
jgi:hypothetical protein